jgi:hypothetical protein
MTHTETHPAVHCSHDSSELAAGEHRTMTYKQISGLPVPSELRLPTCTTCGEWFQDAESAIHIDDQMSKVYTDALVSKAKVALSVISADFRQRDIEPLLGLSAGYLSKVRNDKTEPSPQLAAVLMLLAIDKGRAQELRELWPCGAEEKLLRARLPHISSAVPVTNVDIQSRRTEMYVVRDDEAQPVSESGNLSKAGVRKTG